jgi:hypothetical protein
MSVSHPEYIEKGLVPQLSILKVKLNFIAGLYNELAASARERSRGRQLLPTVDEMVSFFT